VSGPVWRSILLGGGRGPASAERAMTLKSVIELRRLDAAILETPVGSLSLGMKRVIEIGRAIATGAMVLCLDEPAAGLNEAEIDLLGATLRDIAATGRSVLLVEHHMRFVLDLSHDILVLEQGRAVAWWTNSQEEDLPEVLRRHIGALP